MALGYTGNIKEVADSHTQMFGGPAYVCAGLPGDGIWTNIGLVMRAEIQRTLFSQATVNEVMQVMGQSNFQAYQGATITLTMRRFEAEQFVALYPGITAGDTGGLGHNTRPSVITPIGLHVRPQYSYGAAANDESCWWIPAAIAGDDLGTFVFKVENTREANEDFTLNFMAALITQDYTPGTKQAIAQKGQILYRGNTTNIVTNTWEKNMPFGYVEGGVGRVETFTTSSVGTDSLTVNWTAPSSDYIDDSYPITGYQVSYRTVGTGAFTDATAITDATTLTQNITGLSASTTYEFRVAATTSAGQGQVAALEVSTTA